jgi:hypothetical protein
MKGYYKILVEAGDEVNKYMELVRVDILNTFKRIFTYSGLDVDGLYIETGEDIETYYRDRYEREGKRIEYFDFQIDVYYRDDEKNTEENLLFIKNFLKRIFRTVDKHSEMRIFNSQLNFELFHYMDKVYDLKEMLDEELELYIKLQ